MAMAGMTTLAQFTRVREAEPSGAAAAAAVLFANPVGGKPLPTRSRPYMT
jgi:hypothetical protein